MVDLLKDGALKKNLHNATGGSADDLVQTFTLSAAEVGSAANGRWSLRVKDNAADDVGTVKSVKLSFQ